MNVTISISKEDYETYSNYVDLSEIPDVIAKPTDDGVEITIPEKDLDQFNTTTSDAIVIYGMDDEQNRLTDLGIQIDKMYYTMFYKIQEELKHYENAL